MEKCKKRNTERCAKSKQYDQFRASVKKEIWYIAQNETNTTNLEHWKNAKYWSFNIKSVNSKIFNQNVFILNIKFNYQFTHLNYLKIVVNITL